MLKSTSGVLFVVLYYIVLYVFSFDLAKASLYKS